FQGDQHRPLARFQRVFKPLIHRSGSTCEKHHERSTRMRGLDRLRNVTFLIIEMPTSVDNERLPTLLEHLPYREYGSVVSADGPARRTAGKHSYPFTSRQAPVDVPDSRKKLRIDR